MLTAFYPIRNLLLAGLCCSWLVPAQTPPAELKLSVRRNTFLVGEPVVVGVALTNHGREPFQFRPMELLTQTMRYSVEAGSDGAHKYAMASAKDPRMILTLAPGATYRTDQWIDYNYETASLAFPQPGKYTIRGEYVGYLSVKPGPEAAEVSVDIVANSAEQEAAALFGSEDVAGFLTMGFHAPATVAKVQNFVTKNPDSLFAPYGIYALGVFRAAHLAERAPEVPEAIRLLQQVDKPAFQLEPETLSLLTRLESERGNREASLRYAGRLRTEFGNTAAAQAMPETKSLAGPQ